jgi:uncharacterized damage-inducible protein DinB
MISADWCRMMARYNEEMNRRFYAASARLPEAVRQQDGGAFFGSLHATLCHLLWADRAWMARFEGGEAPTIPIAESGRMIGDFATLQAERSAMDARILRWADALTDADLAGDLHWYSQSAGRMMTKPKAVTITHLFLHQNHHRGQAHALLTRHGEDVGVTDLPFVLG